MFSLCRLCANCKDSTELTTQITEIETKLTRCFDWFPSENESQKPPKACTLCVQQLDHFWHFVEVAREADDKLNKLLFEQIQPDSIESVAFEEDIIKPPDSIKCEPEICLIELKELEQPCFDNVENAFDSLESNLSADCAAYFGIRPDKPTKKHADKKIKTEVDSFLAQLDDEDRISDGTISVNGVAKLEKLFPEIINMSWNDCQYKCEKCNRLFQGPHNFFAHNRSIHIDEVQNMTFGCFYCDSRHRREYALSRHMSIEHFKHLKYRCWYCTDYFWDNRELIRHRNMHTNIEYKCELCQQIFMSRDILYSHISQSHQKKRWSDPDAKFTCEICSKDFATKWSIKSHMLQHNKKFDYVCDQCGWKFLTKGNLKGHLETTHSDEKPFECKQCDSKFKTKHQLTNHSKRHEEFKPFVCKVCSKRFRQMYGLTVHMRSHNNICPYTCKYCERKFRHTSSLKTHERTHTSEKPYVCGHCSYRSTNWPNLNKHSMRIHSIDLRIKKIETTVN